MKTENSTMLFVCLFLLLFHNKKNFFLAPSRNPAYVLALEILEKGGSSEHFWGFRLKNPSKLKKCFLPFEIFSKLEYFQKMNEGFFRACRHASNAKTYEIPTQKFRPKNPDSSSGSLAPLVQLAGLSPAAAAGGFFQSRVY